MAHPFKAGDTIRQRPPKVLDPNDPDRKKFIPSTTPTIQGVVRDIREEANADPAITEPVYMCRVDWDDNTACDQWARADTLIPSDHEGHKPMSAPPRKEHMRDIGRATATGRGGQKAGVGSGV